MPGFFSRLKGKDGPSKVTRKKGAQDHQLNDAPAKPRWDDAWTRTSVDPEEVQELLRGCTLEMKSRALDMPFLLLPFRPTSDPSAARTFIRNFFDRSQPLNGDALAQELRLTEPMVLCSVVKWCWGRLPGGVVGWEAYELFKVGESDSNMARDSFATFIPLSVETDSRTKIIFDFFDLLSAVAAHAKSNGLGGRKLSRYAGWWAFEHGDGGKGFEGGYNAWAAAADATSHLFFAYLRSLSPASVAGLNGISTLPISLQKLVQETEYPPERPSLLQSSTLKVVMIVDSVSPTPFALLRRAKNFEYRDDDRALQEFAEYEDPVKALTDECRRVLRSISTANQSQVSNSKDSTGLQDASWSRFEDIGFSGAFDEAEEDDESNFQKRRSPEGLRSAPHPRNQGLGRPTTPSWADFLSSGFVDEAKNEPAPLLLPPDKVLPPIDTRGKSSQSHRQRLDADRSLEPGELASIIKMDLDDSFWWVWISSLAGEEPPERKASFGRCALIETIIPNGRWLVMEEMVKGAAPKPDPNAYIAEKKSFWGRSKKTRVTRSKSHGKSVFDQSAKGRSPFMSQTTSRTSIGPDQHARIQAAAINLQRKQKEDDAQQSNGRRGRNEAEISSQKTSSVFTLQPVIMSEASPAMKWANKYDKDAIREAYLANSDSGKGQGGAAAQTNGHKATEDPTLSIETQAPPVPLKDASQMSPVKSAPEEEPLPEKALSEKALEAGSPQTPHPIDRDIPEAAPAVVEPAEETPRPSVDPVLSPSSSPESKRQGKLKKKESSGFRKMFGRNKNRQSTLPEGVAGISNGDQGLKVENNNALGRRFSGLRKKNPVTTAADAPNPPVAPTPALISEDEATPVASPEPDVHQQPYERSIRDSLSRVGTSEAEEAHQAFSSFDQGPLEDVPAFVPDSPVHEQAVEEAAPKTAVETQPEDNAELSKAGSHDRWAQIRKNASERAARQSEEQSHGGYSQKTDAEDGETSGEETIESRVARIKARVAELTGNMEGTTPTATPSRP